MMNLKINAKLCYLISCIFLLPFLFGCKDLKENVTVIYGLSESSYVSEVKSSLENKKPVVVSFTAEWCPHCRAYKPVFFEVKDLYKDKVTFINVDVDSPEGSPIAERFQVGGIPTTAFIRRDGSIFKVQVGEIEKENLTNLTNDLIASKKKKRGEPIAPFPIELQKIKQPSEQKELPPQELIQEEPKVEPTLPLPLSSPPPEEKREDEELLPPEAVEQEITPTETGIESHEEGAKEVEDASLKEEIP